jgi:hypothetical protein
MSVVALKPYAPDSGDPGLAGYAEFRKARMPNVDPANFAAELWLPGRPGTDRGAAAVQ